MLASNFQHFTELPLQSTDFGRQIVEFKAVAIHC